jgi:hypothetical protein
MQWRRLIVFGLCLGLAVTAGCLTLNSVNQPSQVTPGQNFQITVNFTSSYDDLANNTTRFGAVMLPVGFVVNSATWDGDTVLPEDPAFEAILDADYPPDPGYFWWVGTSDDNSTEGTFDAVLDVTAGNTVGVYLIDYRVGYKGGAAAIYEDAMLDVQLAVGTDSDGDGLIDFWENNYACMMADTVDNTADYDTE